MCDACSASEADGASDAHAVGAVNEAGDARVACAAPVSCGTHSARETKNALRSRMKRIISDAMCSDALFRNRASKAASDVFLSSSLYKNATVICAFASLENEIDTSEIISAAISDKKCVALPKITSLAQSGMDFFLVDCDSLYDISEKLVTGAYNLCEPDNSATLLPVEKIPDSAVFLVPGLAFGKNGARLGHGKGFYDKYFLRLQNARHEVLAENEMLEVRDALTTTAPVVCDAPSSVHAPTPNAPTIIRAGFCFPCQIIDDVPCDEHDVRMTHIITDVNVALIKS